MGLCALDPQCRPPEPILGEIKAAIRDQVVLCPIQ